MKLLSAISGFILLFVIPVISKAQNCPLTCPSNIIVKTDAGKEGAHVNFPNLDLPADCGTVTFTPASGSFFRLGSHSVIVSTSSGKKCSFTVTVTDNQPPTLSPITLSRLMLWPASNKMKKVAVYYTATDNGDNVKTAVSVTSNATDGVKDWEILDNNLLRLKASRLADGSPRIYSITVTATDEAGNRTSRTTTIAVSKTMVPTASK